MSHYPSPCDDVIKGAARMRQMGLRTRAASVQMIIRIYSSKEQPRLKTRDTGEDRSSSAPEAVLADAGVIGIGPNRVPCGRGGGIGRRHADLGLRGRIGLPEAFGAYGRNPVQLLGLRLHLLRR